MYKLVEYMCNVTPANQNTFGIYVLTQYLISLQLCIFTALVPQALLKVGPCLQSEILSYHYGKFRMNLLLNCLT